MVLTKQLQKIGQSDVIVLLTAYLMAEITLNIVGQQVINAVFSAEISHSVYEMNGLLYCFHEMYHQQA